MPIVVPNTIAKAIKKPTQLLLFKYNEDLQTNNTIYENKAHNKIRGSAKSSMSTGERNPFLIQFVLTRITHLGMIEALKFSVSLSLSFSLPFLLLWLLKHKIKASVYSRSLGLHKIKVV